MSIAVCVCVCVFMLLLCLRFVRFTLDYWWRVCLRVYVCVYFSRMYYVHIHTDTHTRLLWHVFMVWFGLVLRGRIESQLYWKRPNRCRLRWRFSLVISTQIRLLLWNAWNVQVAAKREKNTLEMCKFFQLTDRKCIHHFSHPHYSSAAFRPASLCWFVVFSLNFQHFRFVC